MALNNFTKKNRSKLMNIAVILFALVIANNIYKRQNKEIAALRSDKEDQLKKNEVLEDISKLEKRIKPYRELLAKKDSNLSISAIGNIAKESGVKIYSIRPESQQRYPDYIKSPFNLVVSASNYHALGEFISSLEGSTEVYVIDSIDIRPEQNSELTVNLNISSIIFAE